MIKAVVNYYNPSNSDTIRHSVLFCCSLLHTCELIKSVVVVDGGIEPSISLREELTTLGVVYVNLSRKLSFAESYNIGIKDYGKEPYVLTIASDVYVNSDCINRLYSNIRQYKAGAIVPRLSKSDSKLQGSPRVARSRVIDPSDITLNVVLFDREALEQAGLIAENYSGAYNDIVTMINIRKQGRRVLLDTRAYCVHYGSLTLGLSSDYSLKDDEDEYKRQYPDLYCTNDRWKIARWKRPFTDSPVVAAIWWIALHVNNFKVRKMLEKLAIWTELNI